MEQKQNPEEIFRSSLEDVESILKCLTPLCKTPEEMLEMVQLGLTNGGQNRLLMGLVTATNQKQ